MREFFRNKIAASARVYVLSAMICVTLMNILASCNKKDNIDETTGKGYLKGKATDTKGQPIAGATVMADNTILYNSNIQGVTKSDGTYSIKIAKNGAYRAYAWINKQYNGKNYQLYLDPDNTEGFTDEGAVVNFRWRLTGKQPEPQSNYYGGIILIDKVPGSMLYDVENIVFTLVPDGPLIDGSAGSTLTLKSGDPGSEKYSRLADIPIGRYKVSAKYLPENKPLKLRNQYNANATHEEELVLDFEPSSRDGDNVASIEYSDL